MERSIENIWKEGFLKDNALVAPKVNDLYNRKSEYVTDKMVRMMKKNNLAIVAFGIVLAAYTFFTGMPLWFSIFGLLLFVVPAAYVKMRMDSLKKIDTDVNSYQYLQSFAQWLKNQMSFYSTVSRVFYPVCIFTSSLTIWFSKGRDVLMDKILEKYPDLYMIGDFPLIFIGVVLVLMFLAAVFADKIYKWDVNLVYGGIFKKLEEMIADMEELRE